MVRLLLVALLWLLPTTALAAWTKEAGGPACSGMAGNVVLACENTFTADGAQNTPVLDVKACPQYSVELHLAGGATATGFIQSCNNTTPTTCTDLHTVALNGGTVLGWEKFAPNSFIRGRMTAVTLGAGSARLVATCGAGK